MKLSDAEMERALRKYEGLIFSTAQRLVRSRPEQELEDVMQLLRVKAWKALGWFDPAKSKMTLDRYVFMCLRDSAKDIAKKKRHGTLYIEDVAPARGDHPGDLDAPRDRFEHRYLSTDHEQVYGSVDEGELLLPNTLTECELLVIGMMREGFKQTEIALDLAITKREVESAVRSIREKLADWRLGSGDPGRVYDADGVSALAA